MTTTSSFISIVPAREVSTAGSRCISVTLMSNSLKVMIIASVFAAAGAPRKRNVLRSRSCGEGRLNGFPERRFEDGDVLLNAATAYADARGQLAPAGGRPPAPPLKN